MEEVILAEGHKNVSATHTSTFEVTTEKWLTPTGDCILGVRATRGPKDFDKGFVEACQCKDTLITAQLSVNDYQTTVTGYGHPELTFRSEESFVCRTSHYIDDRTIMIYSDSAAIDIDRNIIKELTDGAILRVVLRVEGINL